MSKFEILVAPVEEALSGHDLLFDAAFGDPPYNMPKVEHRGEYEVRWGSIDAEYWRAVVRSCKPGALVAAFSQNGTYLFEQWRQMTDAGVGIFDVLAWLVGNSYAKASNIGHWIDKRHTEVEHRYHGPGWQKTKPGVPELQTPEGRRYGSYMSGMRGLWTPILLGRTPYAGSLVGNVEGWDTGGLNVRDNLVRGEDYDRMPSNVLHSCLCDSDDSHDPDCPIEKLGKSSKYFYVSKANQAERADADHPNVKPIGITRQLAALFKPPVRPDGEPTRLLVPGSGVGSEVAGALLAGWDEVVGIEINPEYAERSRSRIPRLVREFGGTAVEAPILDLYQGYEFKKGRVHQ